MNQNTWCANVPLNEDQYGTFIHRCESAPVAGLEETEKGVRVYLDPNEKPDDWTSRLAEWASCKEDQVGWEEIEGEHWNREWELNFDPIRIGTFCGVRAPFHSEFGEAVDHELIIQPKMAFGTGHHETTAMIIEAMQDISWRGKDVLDWGSGTGILAILAKKLGANRVVALEIDGQACENATENMEHNEVSIDLRQNGLGALNEDDYFDVILANINRNVLLNGRDQLMQHAKEGTSLLLTGIQRRDLPSIQKAYWSDWDQAVEMHFKGNWVCIAFE